MVTAWDDNEEAIESFATIDLIKIISSLAA